MENGSAAKKRWGFQGNPELHAASEITIRGVLTMLRSKLNQSDTRSVIPLGHGDPSAFPCFRTSPIAEDAIAAAVRSAKFNGYSSTVGIAPARRYFYFLFFFILLHTFSQLKFPSVSFFFLKHSSSDYRQSQSYFVDIWLYCLIDACVCEFNWLIKGKSW